MTSHELWTPNCATSSMQSKPQFWLLLFYLGLLHASSVPIRGVHPDLLRSYSKTLKQFHCLDGSAAHPLAFVNDDYCDCVDGSDEPGTSACAGGSFYCANFGFLPRTLPSQFVDDGICDCCDGSDELQGCENTCNEARKELREQLVARIAAVENGLEVKKARVVQGQEMKKGWEEEVVTLEKKVEAMKEEVEEIRKRKVVEDEAAQALKEEEAKKEAIEKSVEGEGEEGETESIKRIVEEEEGEEEEEEEGKPAGDDVVGASHHGGNANEDGSATSSETDEKDVEEVREIGECSEADGGQASKGDDQESVAPSDCGAESLGADVQAGGVHEDAGGSEGFGYDGHDYDDYDYMDGVQESSETEFDQETPMPLPSGGILERVANVAKSIRNRLLPSKNTPATDSQQEERMVKSASKELREAESKLRAFETELTELKDKISRDHGPEGEYLSLEGKCFDHSIEKYKYEMCPFGSAKQMEGSQSTGLGSWTGFDETSKWMIFSGGRHCWNGPNRSIRVGLSCGETDELAEITEPNICEYLALFKTPGACTKDELEKLKNQLRQFIQVDNTKTEL